MASGGSMFSFGQLGTFLRVIPGDLQEIPHLEIFGEVPGQYGNLRADFVCSGLVGPIDGEPEPAQQP